MSRLPSDAPAVRWLTRIAAEASARTGQTIVRIAPRDAAFGWKAASVHPLQPLETEYQGIVRDAVADERDEDRRRKDESRILGEFFFFDSGEPQLLGIDPDQPYAGHPFPLPGDDLAELRRRLRAVMRELERPRAADMERAVIASQLKSAWERAYGLLERFYTLIGARDWRISPVEEADSVIRALSPKIEAVVTAPQANAIVRELDAAANALERALGGVGSIQMFYDIQPFALFRLLVRFRLESAAEISPETRAKASGALTSLLNDERPWLSDWLRESVIALGDSVKACDPYGNILFFLKGGRALEYHRHGRNDRGTGDWDTQVLINPNLPPAEWYRLFVRANNAVLVALEKLKIEFFMLLSRHAAEFAHELEPLPILDGGAEAGESAGGDAPERGRGEDDDGPRAPHHANCKAELIDVGLPRYDSVEAREQWSLFTGDACRIRTATDGMPHPDALYYVDEYVTMIREVFAGGGAGLRKAPKRIVRLRHMLDHPESRIAIERFCGGDIADLFPDSREILGLFFAGDQDGPAKLAIWLLLHQFAVAYHLRADRDLARRVDQLVALNLGSAGGLAPYPPLFPTLASEQDGYDGACRRLADAIGFAQWVSAAVEENLKQRGAFMVEQRELFSDLARKLAGLFPFDEEWDLQIATAGSFGAWLHGDYQQFAGQDQLDPVTFMRIGVYSPNAQSNPADMLRIIADRLPSDFFGEPVWDNSGRSIRLYWPEECQWDRLKSYRPLAVEIVAHAAPRRPHLAYIWGIPVLGLRDLVEDARDAIAGALEFGRRRRLICARGALVEMMTRTAPPLVPLGDDLLPGHGRRYLLVRSDSLAVGRVGAYPTSFYRDRANQLTLTGDRAALRKQILEWPVPEDDILDLLVVGGGEGRWGSFADWREEDLKRNFIEPLDDRGVRVKVIVLDFALSASLLPAFRLLCADDGIVISSLYRIEDPIMTTRMWARLQPVLDGGRGPTLTEVLWERLRAMSADLTGYSHLDTVRTMSENALATHLHRHPVDRDAISIIRYLPHLAALARGEPHAWVHVSRWLRVANPNIGNGEYEIIAELPVGGALSPAMKRNLRMKFRKRLEQILTAPNYGIEIDIAGRAEFEGDESLWAVLKRNQSHILGLAPDLSRCPTPFSIWTQGDSQLELDSALAPQVTDKAAKRITEIDDAAPDDVERVVGNVLDRCDKSSLLRRPNYLQR